MKVSWTGIILNTEEYDECVSFYGDLFGLKVLFKENEGDFKLTCFEFQGSYLMVETAGVAKPKAKSMEESCTKLRFNVSDIEEALSTITLFALKLKSWEASGVQQSISMIVMAIELALEMKQPLEAKLKVNH